MKQSFVYKGVECKACFGEDDFFMGYCVYLIHSGGVIYTEKVGTKEDARDIINLYLRMYRS